MTVPGMRSTFAHPALSHIAYFRQYIFKLAHLEILSLLSDSESYSVVWVTKRAGQCLSLGDVQDQRCETFHWREDKI